MSNWTHVAAVIRIDAIRLTNTKVNWDEIFGKECLWGSGRSVWEDMYEHPEKYLPHGSEGSLRKTIWTNPDKSNLDSYTVTVFGDLRDHDNIDAIIDWFNKSCDKCMIRQACITVRNEWFGVKTVEYDRSRPENIYNQKWDDDENSEE